MVAWLVLGAMALTACLPVLGAIAEDVHDQEAIVLDNLANPLLHGLASAPLDAIMDAATFLGSVPAIPVLLVVALAVLLVGHRHREALFLVIAIGGSLAIDQVLKLVFHRPRPVLAWAHAGAGWSLRRRRAEARRRRRRRYRVISAVTTLSAPGRTVNVAGVVPRSSASARTGSRRPASTTTFFARKVVTFGE